MFLALVLPGAAAADTLFIVTNTNDNGAGTLRQAITNANRPSAPTASSSRSPAAGSRSSSPDASPDHCRGSRDLRLHPGRRGSEHGRTRHERQAQDRPERGQQPDYRDGGRAHDLGSGLSLVEGLVINRFRGAQISLQSGASSTSIRGSFIRCQRVRNRRRRQPDGWRRRSQITSDDNLFGGALRRHRNLISGNAGDGLQFGAGSSGSFVRGNLIGTAEAVSATSATASAASRSSAQPTTPSAASRWRAGTFSPETASPASRYRTSTRTGTTSPATTSAWEPTGGPRCRTRTTAYSWSSAPRSVIGSTSPRRPQRHLRKRRPRHPPRRELERRPRQLHRHRQHGSPRRRKRRGGRVRVGERLADRRAHRRASKHHLGERRRRVQMVATGLATEIDDQNGYIGTNAAGTRALNDGDGVEPDPGSNLTIGGAISAQVRAPGSVISGTADTASTCRPGLQRRRSMGTSSEQTRGEQSPSRTCATGLRSSREPTRPSGLQRPERLLRQQARQCVHHRHDEQHRPPQRRIGTNRAGTAAVPNRVGVEVDGSGSHSIGEADFGNVISNRGAGLWIHGQTSAIVVLTNLVGLGADGKTAVPNRRGIVVSGGRPRTTSDSRASPAAPSRGIAARESCSPAARGNSSRHGDLRRPDRRHRRRLARGRTAGQASSWTGP